MNYVYQIVRTPDVFAVVRNAFGEEKFRIPDTGLPKSDHGGMKDENDIAGLENYLKRIGVMQQTDELTTFAEAEAYDNQVEQGRYRKGGKLFKSGKEIFEVGGSATQKSILQMLNDYEPAFAYQNREKAFHEFENDTTKEKSYYLELTISPSLISLLNEPGSSFIDELVENFKTYGYSKGFSSLLYEVVLDETHNHILFHAIEILKHGN